MEKESRVLFFDFLRCVAAVAVIAIHVLAPYRDQMGVIPDSHWLTAVSVNGATRWAVPVFILISGALLLSDRRPFEFGHYVQRRLGKVVVPFIVWSLFYALLSGLDAQGFHQDTAMETLSNSPHHATYYHLGFFYYFIPLYFVIPFLQWLNNKMDENQEQKVWSLFVGLWLLTTTLFLLHIDGPWSSQIWLYTGYLPLGYLLFKKVTITRFTVAISILLGCASIYLTIHSVVDLSAVKGHYSVGRWLSYKTLNVVLAASMIFMVGRALAPKLSEGAQRWVSFISQHSLGIYLLHPIFLWPMKAYGWHQGHPAWVIPLWVLLSGAGALAVSWLFSRSGKTRWLLP